MATFAVLIPAAGSSRRFGDGHERKIHAELGGRAIWLRSVEPFLARADVGQVVVAIHPDERESFLHRYQANIAFMNLTIVDGGEQRVDSVQRMLAAIEPLCDFVAVHDAARPFPAADLIERVFAAAVEHGAALPGVAVADTLKRADELGVIVETVARRNLFAVQTPQVFRRELLERAYAQRAGMGDSITDDAMLVEAIGHSVRIVDGAVSNLKITTRDDLALAQAIVSLREERGEKPRFV